MLIHRLLNDRSGATAIEYGLIAALIVIGMLVALQGVAGQNTTMWNSIAQKSNDAIQGSTS
jgi:pilus assembly protein Flp/PilA